MEVLLNGEFVPYEKATVPIDDRGFQFGESVYEVIHVYAGKPFEMARHMRRLQVGLEALDIDMGMSTGALGERCMELVKRNGLEDALVYIQITSGAVTRIHLRPTGLRPTIIVTTSQAAPAPARWPDTGISCVTMSDERWAGCYVKTTMLAANTMAKRRSVAAGYTDAIFVRDGYVLESTASNLFAVYDGVLWTPPASNYILRGITREVVLDVAKEIEIPFYEGPIPLRKLYEADELFVTASGIELTAVASVDGKTIGTGRPGPVLGRIRESFRQKTSGR